jgi:hypothetical protein
MPREYWTALRPEQKTEEEFQDHLKEEIVRSWSWLFVPAVICFGVGFVFILVEALKLTLAEPQIVGIGLATLLAIAVLVPIVLGKIMGPKIYD